MCVEDTLESKKKKKERKKLQRLFYGVSEQEIFHVMSRRMQGFFAIKLPRSGTEKKGHLIPYKGNLKS
jgi:hypothetical protein